MSDLRAIADATAFSGIASAATGRYARRDHPKGLPALQAMLVPVNPLVAVILFAATSMCAAPDASVRERSA